MVDFSKHKHGDVVVVHCCDECARKAGVNPKRPADSGKASWLCDVCGHHGIGSLTDCEIGDWLRLRPLQPNDIKPAACGWSQDGDSYSDTWATSCGHYFRLDDGTPTDNKMAFCCYCGKSLVSYPFVEDEDEDE